MKGKAIFTTNFLLNGIFVIALFILVFTSSVTYKHTVVINESTELLVHSYQIQIQLERLESFVKEAETGQRGYIITKDPNFLQPYNSAREEIKNPVFTLKYLTSQNPQQQQNLDSLLRLVNLRFALLAASLDIISDEHSDKKMLDENMTKGKNVMDYMRIQINMMVDLEVANFNKHQKKYNREISITPVFTLILFIFTMIFLIISYLKIQKDLIIQRKTNEKLLISIESIKHAEIIGEFGISQWDMKTGEVSFSDNLYALLGCEPQSFEPTVDNYLKFVHPDDRHIVSDGREKIMENNANPLEYRIIRKDGELRHFKSMGKIITDTERSKLHVGIDRDITQQHLSELALVERNRELENIVNELDSFNRVASHDLQEPLRKIQTFISRLSDKELAKISDTSREYIAKIKTSANTMRMLIDDLLLFSRANKIEKVFEQTDFNILIENVRQELSQTIEEKNAVLTVAHLPNLNVIAFQIQQLFVNLIGNSLKYCKPDIYPEINIDCELIQSNDYPILNTDAQKRYYKISVTDNGLGFEQKYAETIFTLFQRLHNKSEYPGTGIGLSICKKIVENHNGFIIAEGKPGMGSTFTVFLPE
jgi:signal transduction histidine kinase/CHASE3 domain sensor protein